MFSIILDIWAHIASMKPAFFSRTHLFSFITLHYIWIIGMSIFGSICLFPNGEIAYIDALFLGSGAATQSGLNTVNINQINTWQQIALYVIPMVTNPVTINTFVVFLRLYWFEKRFQHIVTESKKSRRSISQTITNSRAEERHIELEERGIRGRRIVVMHNEELDKRLEGPQTAKDEDSSAETSTGDRRGSGEERAEPNFPVHQTQIKFAAQVKRSDGMADEALRMPITIQRNPEDHIALLERQRNLDEGAVLRIPGPRDADAGVPPTAVYENDPATRVVSHRASTFDSRRASEQWEALDDANRPVAHARHRNITIAVPTRSPTSERMEGDVPDTFRNFRFRKPRIQQRHNAHEDSAELSPTRSRAPTIQSIRTALSKERDHEIPYLSWQPTVGRNSAFVDLTESQREELGGIEYRSLKSLALILTLYFWGFSIFGLVCLVPWILHSKTYGPVVEQVGQGRPWWGVFTANSAFTDTGFTLTPNSMMSFQRAVWPLLLLSFLVIIGNTGFPIMLRFILWVTSQYVPRSSGIFEELKFLLDHPRRCFTLLFPSKATWWLFWILVILNGLDLMFFIVLDLGNTIVTELPVGIRILDGWFQAVSTRTAGFAVVNIAELHPAIQVSYLIMMYISALPIAISVRRTNVYEEKSLGIYGTAAEQNEDEGEPSYVGAHLRRQLSFDLWYIFLGFFIIAIAEGPRLQSGDPGFTMFAVLFEVVSAYGTVGLSLGYPGIDESFSAEFGVIGKLVIIAMQIRGRHRGLPYELDRAILLPSENLHEKEAHDAAIRMRRRSAAASTDMTPVNSGAVKADRGRGRGRSRSLQRGAQNLLGTLLYPGPIIPNSHRNPHIGDTNDERKRSRSMATFSSARDGRSISSNPGC